jgi:nucleoside-diphosphate-sugar epimerase
MILVTGGTGFLGSYIVRQLVKQDEQVRVIFRPGANRSLLSDVADKVEWFEADILDVVSLEDALQGIDRVYHAAAIVSFLAKDRKKMMQVNVEGTANLVNLCLDMRIQKLLHVSSVAALGRSKPKQEITELNNWVNHQYNSNYAISKFLAEQEVWRGITEGLHAVIINPSVILGGGFWDMGTCKMFRQVDKGLKFAPLGLNGYVDVRDVANIAVQLMNSDISSERFIVNGQNIHHREVLLNIASAMHKKGPAFTVGKKWTSIAWRLDTFFSAVLFKSPVITREITMNMNNVYHYKNNKVVEALQYAFIPFEKTISDTVKIYDKSRKIGHGYLECL